MDSESDAVAGQTRAPAAGEAGRGRPLQGSGSWLQPLEAGHLDVEQLGDARLASMPLRAPGTAVMTPMSSSSRRLRMTVESARSSTPILSLSATYCFASGSLIFLRSCIRATRSPAVRMPPMPEASAWLIDIP